MVAFVWLLLCVALPALGEHEDSLDYTLRVQREPSGAHGGVVWLDQPEIRAYRSNAGYHTGDPATFVDGVNITASLSFSEPFVADAAPVLLSTTSLTTTFVAGIANFSGLYIREAGQYVVNFAVDGVAQTDSHVLNITVGPPHHINVSTQVGTALPTLPFAPQPALTVYDLGGNVVVDADLTVTAALTMQPAGVSDVLLGTSLEAVAVNGTAQFVDLALTKAGYPFQLTFYTDFGMAENATSELFTVSVGPTVAIAVVTEPAGAVGGVPFGTQPTVALVDAGGNVNTADNFTSITVSLGVNPSAATLYPAYLRFELPGVTASLTTGSTWVTTSASVLEYLVHGDWVEFGPVHEPVLVEERTYADVEVNLVREDLRLRLQEPWAGENLTDVVITRLRDQLTRPVTNGMVTWDELHIDRIGFDYTLVFTSSMTLGGQLLPETGKLGQGRGYGRTDGANITGETLPFDVGFGAPSWLTVETNVSACLANGQPFGVQPRVGVVDKGGNLLTNQVGANVTVSLNANPTNATLFGTTAAEVVRGVAEFLDLGVTHRGRGLTLDFATDIHGNNLTHVFDCGFSAEYMVAPSDRYPRDFFGAAVAVAGDTAVVGAPLENNEIREIQTITTSAGSTVFLDEVQIVTTTSDHVDATQRVTLLADAGFALGGNWSLTWDGQGPTRFFPVDIHTDYVKVTLENDLMGTGEVTVTRAAACDGDDDRGCEAGYTYDVTFDDLFGEVPVLGVDDTMLAATNATSGEEAGPGQGFTAAVDVVTPSTLIGGNFTLGIAGHVSAALPHNATAGEVEAALEAFAADVTVSRDGPDLVDGFVWSVTFTATDGDYDVPTMVSDAAHLAAVNGAVHVHTHVDGQAPVGGSFRIMFRGEGPSEPIPYDADNNLVAALLATIPTIDLVEVTSDPVAADRGRTWVVTFINTRTPTEEGLRMDGMDYRKAFFLDDPFNTNLEPVEYAPTAYVWKAVGDPAVGGELTGTEATVTVTSVFGNPESPLWDPARAGSPGDQAGAAYVFGREGEKWVQLVKLRGHDTDDYDRYGSSVGVASGGAASAPETVIVGAPGASDDGLEEVQRVYCLANGGTFHLSFRGQQSDRLGHDATLGEVEDALVGVGGITGVRVEATLAENPAGRICGSPAAVESTITISYPSEGDLPLLVPTNDDPSLERFDAVVRRSTDGLTLDGVAADANMTIAPEVDGTAMNAGVNSTMANVGAAYLYEYDAALDMYYQVAKLMAGAAPGDRAPGDAFGAALSASGSVVAVGAPGYDAGGVPDRGSVFVYTYDGVGWPQHQEVVHEFGAAEDRFGAVVALFESTLVVTAPRAGDHQGVVYVYRHPPGADTRTVFFHLDQTLEAPGAGEPAPAPWLQFGHSLGLEGDTLAVGCPGCADAGGAPRGAVHVYDRLSHTHNFGPREVLTPSTSLSYDRAGAAVAVHDNTLVACARANMTASVDALTPVREVQLVQSSAAPGATLGNNFQLQWRRVFVGVARSRLGGVGSREGSGQWEGVATPPIPVDAEEPEFRAVLEGALGTGRVNVERFGPSQEGGYRWYVTFLEQPEGGDLPLMAPLTANLTGDGAAVVVTRFSSAAAPVRAACTAFTRTWDAVVGTASAGWTEQAVLHPHAHQGADLYGTAVAVDGNVALVGAPNRDYEPSGLNPGAAFFTDLAFLNIRLSARRYDIDENGGSLAVPLHRCNPVCHVAPGPAVTPAHAPDTRVWFRTADGDTWGVYDALGAPFPAGGDAVNRRPAVGRADCHPESVGAHDCEWVGGDSAAFQLSAYDFRAVNDYAPVDHEVALNDTDATGANLTLVVTNDAVVEAPDEFLKVQLYAPGVEPSYGGDLWADVRIGDDGDGGVGARGYVEKLFLGGEAPEAGAAFGQAVGLGLGGSRAVVGAPGSDAGNATDAGSAVVYAAPFGLWEVEAVLELPAGNVSAHARFGASVAMDRSSGEVVAVGAPGAPFVAVFRRTGGNETSLGVWAWEATLVPGSPPGGALRAEHHFGARHAVAVDGGRLAVGCRGLEAVFVWHYLGGAWVEGATLRASTYRDTTWLAQLYLFREHFGASVALDNGTLVVGAPHAHYGNLSEPAHFRDVLAVEPFIRYHGTGAALVYELVGANPNATAYPYGVPDGAGGGEWVEQATLLAPDGKAADRFGEAVALHRSQVVVGAPHAPASPTTTWDFEAGTLAGWTATGTAFVNQPTFGDNTAFRNVYSTHFGPGAPQSSRHRGRYWVGTYERRPGDAADVHAEPPTAAGTVQGDGPQGTLTSQAFLVAGDRISFLVGGGCREREEYVELLVDGDPTLRATGACSEAMARVHWNVSMHRGRSAQIRVVDASSAGWAHINVDDFRFDWAMQGYEESWSSGAAYAWRRKAAGDTEEPCVAHPRQPAELSPVSFTPLECEWQFQQRLVPSDKRSGTRFGHDVAVDDVTGTAVVGAVQSTATRPDWDLPGSVANVQLGAWGSQFSARADGGINSGDVGGLERHVWPGGANPFLGNVGSGRGGRSNSGAGGWDSAGFSMAFGGSGGQGSTGNRFSHRGGTSGLNTNAAFDTGSPFTPDRLGTGVRGQAAGVRPTNRASTGGKAPDNAALDGSPAPTGLVYVFDRLPNAGRGHQLASTTELRDGKFRLLTPPAWASQQHSTLALGWMGAGYRLGAAVALDGYTALLGAPGDSALGAAAGSAVVVDTEYQRVRFGETVYPVAEDFHLRRVTVVVLRDGDLSGSLSVHYSTRDVTAVGVNATYHAACLTFPQTVRSLRGCGDYAHKAGELYFAPQDYSAAITIDVLDDDCYEDEPEFFVVQLSVPGGAAVLGEGLATTVRIDDDDFGEGRAHCLPPREPVLHPDTPCVACTLAWP